MIRDLVVPVAGGNCSELRFPVTLCPPSPCDQCYGGPDWNQGAVGRTALSFSSSSSSRRQKLFLHANLSLSLSISSYPMITSLCKARPSKRNPDFSRKYRGSSSKNKRQNLERENSENLEDNLFPSKNGPLVSLSNNQRYSATATPGRREKEIVELFRKVQSQLRERAAIKEEKRVESAQHGPGERGTVDSLLKLLRKHSVAQGKRSGSSDDGYDLDQPERTNPFDEPETSDLFEDEQHSSFLVSENLGASQNGDRDPKPIPFTRPTSSFRRKSPVPKVKFQPVFSAEEEGGGNSIVNPQKKITGLSSEHDRALEPPAWHLLESEDDELITKLGSLDGDSELSVDPSEPSDFEETDPGISGASMIQSTGLSTMKVSELRGLAKSKGIKGYSKLKKIELLELLTVSS